MRPIIGITLAHVEEEINTYPREYYVRAVVQAGGTPILLPCVNEPAILNRYLMLVNGLILTGGSDVAPSAFGEEPVLGTGKVYSARDDFELELVRGVLAKNLPVLGICRGAQVVNIAFGGDIYQDIYSQVAGVLEHNQKVQRDKSWHTVEICSKGLISKIITGNSARVNSFHHQAIRKPATGFSVAARAKDGIIEAIEAMDYRFAVGVQWHPEAMLHDTNSRNLFAALIDASCKTLV